MASKKPHRQWTSRVDAIATFLYRTPAMSQQVYSVSQEWGDDRIASLDRTQRLLNALRKAGWLSRFTTTYAPVADCYYYKLTLKGYRKWLDDPKAKPPTKRFCTVQESGPYKHLYARSQFLTKLTMDAARLGLHIERDRPENTEVIRTRSGTLWHDGSLHLLSRRGRRFPLIFEFDRSTESLTSTVEMEDTWIRKNQRYLDHCNRSSDSLRPRVVPVTTRSRERLDNILALFGMQNGTKYYHRQLYLGVYLEDFLAAENGITDCIFADHRKSGLSLIPPHMLDALPQGRNLSATSSKCMLLPCLEDHVQTA